MDDLDLRLSQVDVFKQLPGCERSHLAETAIHHKLDMGEFLVYQGDQWSKLLLVGSGALKWFLLSESGKEHVFFTLESGSIFWGHTIFDDQPMPASLAALRPTEVYTWAKEILQPVFYRYPEVMWEIGKSLISVMRRNREVVINLAFRHVAGRLATLLLDRFSDPDDISIERDLTLDEIASRVASSPEVVSRVLHQFQTDGILEVTRATITLFDRIALENLIEPS